MWVEEVGVVKMGPSLSLPARDKVLQKRFLKAYQQRS